MISAASLCLCIFLYFIAFWNKSGLVVSVVWYFSIFIFMNPTRSGYKELGFGLVEPLRDQPRKPRRPPMVKEKKDDGIGCPIKILLEEALENQRNAMMDNFA